VSHDSSANKVIGYSVDSGSLNPTSGIALGYGLDDRGFESRQPPTQWVPEALSESKAAGA
jgi:hypothetical protein